MDIMNVNIVKCNCINIKYVFFGEVRIVNQYCTSIITSNISLYLLTTVF